MAPTNILKRVSLPGTYPDNVFRTWGFKIEKTKRILLLKQPSYDTCPLKILMKPLWVKAFVMTSAKKHFVLYNIWQWQKSELKNKIENSLIFTPRLLKKWPWTKVPCYEHSIQRPGRNNAMQFINILDYIIPTLRIIPKCAT